MADKPNTMTVEQAADEAAALRQTLNEWRRQYYDEDAPNVEDSVYDQSMNGWSNSNKLFHSSLHRIHQRN